ncbi:MAG TPA: RidA family protein, partial [Acidimicrobiales bacterium]|nr:RidA family protein [Acidimicrobiales bacterium]
VGDFDTQARQAVRNLDRVLKAAGSSLDQVIKVTIFVTDMSYFPEVVALRGEVFSQPYPADTICEVQALAYPELMFEIEAIALVDGNTIDIAHS